MQITNLIPDTEVYFEYNGKVRKGVYKETQRTNSGKLVKSRNKLIEIINKDGNTSILIVSRDTKFYNSKESLMKYKEKLLIEYKKREELLIKQYNEELDKIKDSLSKLENINQLPIYNKAEDFINECYTAVFDNEPSFSLQDGTKIKMTKLEYQCILHDLSQCEGYYIYKINNNLFMCFDCGELLAERQDLIDKYRREDNFGDIKYLFPKKWSEDRIIDWIKRRN